MTGLAVPGLLAGPTPAYAAAQVALYVTHGATGDCTSPATACGSIQSAINAAQSNYSGDDVTVNVGGGSFAEHDTINASALASLTIAGARSTTVDGGKAGPVFTVENGTVTISSLTITDGLAANGGGIDNTDTAGSLTIKDSTITGNATDHGTNSTISPGGNGGNGGGIYNSGSLTIESSTISGNTTGGGGDGRDHRHYGGFSGGAGGNGGGINNIGTVVIESSTISGNTTGGGGPGAGQQGGGAGGNGGGINNTGTLIIAASNISGNTNGGGGSGVHYTDGGGYFYGAPGGNGGGIDNSSIGTLTIDSSTISGNSAGAGGGSTYYSGNGGNGGGIVNDGTASVNSSTISGNAAGQGQRAGYSGMGGGIESGGTAKIAATIVASSGFGDCSGTITDQGYNLADDGSCTSFGSTSLPDSPALLDPRGLQDNGGATQTIALEPGSPAIGAVNGGSLCSTPDQRGVVRQTPCDIGAYESPHPTWTGLSPSSAPSSRQGASMAYDPSTGQFLLFGGTFTSTKLGDTWVWNGSNWSQLSPPNSPSIRGGASMAYDAATGQLLLFGGNLTSTPYSDTWVWNGTTWGQLSPATSPPARRGASMAYDAASGQLVLFGGVGNKSALLGDTWTWSGTTWVQQAPASSPSARSGASLAYDPTTTSLVLYGGSNGGYPGDTWTWNGATWTQRSPATSPSPRSGTSMAFDTTTRQMVLFGGDDSTGTALGDTWAWDGSTWTQQSPTSSPPARNNAPLADDPATGQLVLFGGVSGSGPLDDTQVWGPTVPGAPTIGAATAGDASAIVTFSPGFDLGSPISSYTVTATDITNPANGGEKATGSGSPITVTGLTNGDSYTFTVTGTNGVGTSLSSAASNMVVPATVPDAPTIGTATPGNGQATVSFSPGLDEGSAITSYTVTATDVTNPGNGGETATGSASPIIVTGLTNGDSYRFSVTATNGVGTGLPSAASNMVVPAIPLTVTLVTPTIPQGDSKVATVIQGSGFTTGATVSVSGSGITLKSATVVNGTTIDASTSVSSATPIGTYDVTVTESGSSATCSGCLTVTPGPHIVSAAPIQVAVGSKGAVTFLGTGLTKGAKVIFSRPSTTFTATNVTSTGTSITGTIKVPANAPLGAYKVRVTNKSGGSGICATCFSIIAAPTFTQMTPSSAARGSVTPVTLTGSGFVIGAKVAGPSGVTFTNVTVVSSTTITATMKVSATATPGTNLGITVTNNAAAGYGRATAGVLSIT